MGSIGLEGRDIAKSPKKLALAPRAVPEPFEVITGEFPQPLKTCRQMFNRCKTRVEQKSVVLIEIGEDNTIYTNMTGRGGLLNGFDLLLKHNIQHIWEEIFLSLEYDSFQNCTKVTG